MRVLLYPKDIKEILTALNLYAKLTTMNPSNPKTTHFGYQEVPVEEKAAKVAEVFHSVAKKYDTMNDLMSFGLHRAWKQFALLRLQVSPGHQVLDLAGGTGDLAIALSALVGETGKVILADINASMLQVAFDRILDQGLQNSIALAQVDAQTLAFSDNSFDRIIMGFGLRNVTDKTAALQSLYRVLKPGGRLLVLEFSQPIYPGLGKIYDWYSFHVLPKLGQWIANDAASYQYLAESIRRHPNQADLKQLILSAGFDECCYHQLTGGIVACHVGYKY